VIAQSDDESPRLRFQVALSLGESRDPSAAKALAKLARSSWSDPWIRTAILSSASSPAFDLLKELLFDDAFRATVEGRDTISQLVSLVGARNQSPEVYALLQQLAEHAPLPELSSQQLILALGRGLKQRGVRLHSKSDMPISAVARTGVMLNNVGKRSSCSAWGRSRIHAKRFWNCWT
jgi:hypothetical protein